MPANNCHNCSYCKSVAAVEVTGDDHATKREFERIERACQHRIGWELKHKVDAQTKTPSADTDGV